MPVKLIVTDLDGTLLRSDKTVSDHSAAVFRRCRQAGVKIVFATARPERVVFGYLEQVPTDAVICHNGAVAFIDNRPVMRRGVAPETSAYVLAALARAIPDAKLCIELDGILYANYNAAADWSNTDYTPSDFTGLPQIPADKIIARASGAAEIERIAALLPEGLYVQSSENKHGLIMSRGATKFSAIRFLADRWGIPTAEVAAFGDDYNDVEMLRECGIGVAVANALDEAKAAADEVCGSNDDDGVAKWIEGKIL